MINLALRHAYGVSLWDKNPFNFTGAIDQHLARLDHAASDKELTWLNQLLHPYKKERHDPVRNDRYRESLSHPSDFDLAKLPPFNDTPGIMENKAAVLANTSSISPDALSIPENFSDGQTLEFIVDRVKMRSLVPGSTNSMVIVIPGNQAYIGHVLNLVCSWERIGIQRNKILVWALDVETQQALLNRGIWSYVDESLFHETMFLQYGKGNYFKMMNERPKFFDRLLNLGVDILFTDADIAIVRNPLPHIINLFRASVTRGRPIADLIIQNDEGAFFDLKRASIELPEMCGGFFYLRNSVNSKQLIQDLVLFLNMTAQLGFTWENDQSGLNYLIRSRRTYVLNNMPDFPSVRPSNPELVMQYLDQLEFPSGHMVFSNRWPQRPASQDLCHRANQTRVPFIIHANSCHSKMACLNRHHLVMVNLDNGRCSSEEFTEDQLKQSLCKVTRWF